jgi:predicted nucleic acid-binding protein
VIYLLDTSALVRLLRDPKLQEAWYDAIDAEAIASCYPQRAEFLYSARDAAEYDEIAEMLADLYPDAAVPKTAGRWISAAQYQMARAGHHRSASAVDLMIAATAAHHGLTVLHDDADYRTVARHAPDLAEHNINDIP